MPSTALTTFVHHRVSPLLLTSSSCNAHALAPTSSNAHKRANSFFPKPELVQRAPRCASIHCLPNFDSPAGAGSPVNGYGNNNDGFSRPAAALAPHDTPLHPAFYGMHEQPNDLPVLMVLETIGHVDGPSAASFFTCLSTSPTPLSDEELVQAAVVAQLTGFELPPQVQSQLHHLLATVTIATPAEQTHDYGYEDDPQPEAAGLEALLKQCSFPAALRLLTTLDLKPSVAWMDVAVHTWLRYSGRQLSVPAVKEVLLLLEALYLPDCTPWPNTTAQPHSTPDAQSNSSSSSSAGAGALANSPLASTSSSNPFHPAVGRMSGQKSNSISTPASRSGCTTPSMDTLSLLRDGYQGAFAQACTLADGWPAANAEHDNALRNWTDQAVDSLLVMRLSPCQVEDMYDMFPHLCTTPSPKMVIRLYADAYPPARPGALACLMWLMAHTGVKLPARMAMSELQALEDSIANERCQLAPHTAYLALWTFLHYKHSPPSAVAGHIAPSLLSAVLRSMSHFVPQQRTLMLRSLMLCFNCCFGLLAAVYDLTPFFASWDTLAAPDLIALLRDIATSCRMTHGLGTAPSSTSGVLSWRHQTASASFLPHSLGNRTGDSSNNRRGASSRSSNVGVCHAQMAAILLQLPSWSHRAAQLDLQQVTSSLHSLSTILRCGPSPAGTDLQEFAQAITQGWLARVLPVLHRDIKAVVTKNPAQPLAVAPLRSPTPYEPNPNRQTAEMLRALHGQKPSTECLAMRPAELVDTLSALHAVAGQLDPRQHQMALRSVMWAFHRLGLRSSQCTLHPDDIQHMPQLLLTIDELGWVDVPLAWVQSVAQATGSTWMDSCSWGQALAAAVASGQLLDRTKTAALRKHGLAALGITSAGDPPLPGQRTDALDAMLGMDAAGHGRQVLEPAAMAAATALGGSGSGLQFTVDPHDIRAASLPAAPTAQLACAGDPGAAEAAASGPVLHSPPLVTAVQQMHERMLTMFKAKLVRCDLRDLHQLATEWYSQQVPYHGQVMNLVVEVLEGKLKGAPIQVCEPAFEAVMKLEMMCVMQQVSDEEMDQWFMRFR